LRLIAILITSAFLLSGCLAADTKTLSPAGGAAKAAANMTMPWTTAFDGNIPVSVATPARSFSNDVVASGKTLKHTANITGYLVEVKWTPVDKLSDQLSLWVRQAGDGKIDPNDAPGTAQGVVTNPAPIAKQDGKSSIRLVLDASKLKADTEYLFLVRASANPVGASKDQPFKMWITAFPEMPVDKDFSAIPK
jgi:hypothetical protein